MDSLVDRLIFYLLFGLSLYVMYGVYLGLYRVFGLLLGYRSDVLKDSFKPEHIGTTTFGFQSLVVGLDVFISWLSSFIMVCVYVFVDVIDPNIYIRRLAFYFLLWLTQIIAIRLTFRVKSLVGVRGEYLQGDEYSRNWDFVYRMYGVLISTLMYVVIYVGMMAIMVKYVMPFLNHMSSKFTFISDYEYLLEQINVIYLMLGLAIVVAVLFGILDEIFRYFDSMVKK